MPEFDLLDRFGDLDALERQTQQILGLIKQIEDGGAKAATVLKNIKFSGSTAGSGIEAQVKAMKDFSVATEGYTKKVVVLAGQEAKLIEIQKKKSDLAAKQTREQREKVQLDAEVVKQITLEDKAEQQNIRTKQERIKYEDALEKQKQKGLNQQAAEAKIAEQLTNEYYQLNQALKDAELRYKNLALTQGFEAEATKEALDNALSMRNVLDKLDGNLRNHQRNVGNYKSAFDGLGYSFTNVARELPALAINTQTFLLAISNNLPILFDEIRNARTEISKLQEQGLQAPSLAEKIGKSLLSFNVISSILIATFTILGPKIIEGIKGLFGYSDAEEKAAKAALKLIEAQREQIKLQKELDILYKDPIVDSDRLEVELKMAQALNKSKGDQLKLELDLARQKSLAANIKFQENRGFSGLQDAEDALLKADVTLTMLNQALDRIENGTAGAVADGEKEALEAKRETAKVALDIAKENVAEQKKIVLENFQFLNEEYAKEAEIAEYNRQQKLDKEISAAVLLQNKRIAQAEIALGDDRNFEKAKTAALEKEAAARIAIVKKELLAEQRNPANRNADGTKTAELLRSEREAAAEIYRTQLKLEDDKYKLFVEFRNRRLKAENDWLQAELGQNIEFNKQIVDSEYFTAKERLEALVSYVGDKETLIVASYALEIATKVHTTEELKALEAKKNKELNDLLIEGNKERSNIIVTSGVQEIKAYEAAEDRRVSFQKYLNAKFISNKKQREDENAKLDYDSKRSELLKEVQHQQDILAAINSTAAAKVDAQNELNKKMAALYKLDTDYFLSEQDRKLAGLEKFKSDTLEVVDLLNGAQNIAYIEQRNRLRDEQDAAEKRADREIEIANAQAQQGIITQEEAANRVQVIEARKQAQKEQFERRNREIEVQKAKFDKAKTLFNIGLEIAMALSTLNFFKAAIATVQLAIVAATPIPRYFKGKKKGQSVPGGGMAIVDEGPTGAGNAPEAIIRKDGSIEIGGNKPRTTYLDRDDEVVPHDYLSSVYGLAFRDHGSGGRAIEDKTERLLEAQIEGNNLLREIADKPVQVIQGSEKGVRVLHAWATRQIEYVNDKTNF